MEQSNVYTIIDKTESMNPAGDGQRIVMKGRNPSFARRFVSTTRSVMVWHLSNVYVLEMRRGKRKELKMNMPSLPMSGVAALLPTAFTISQRLR